MAANSGGTIMTRESSSGSTSSSGEWNSLIKPFVAYSVGSLTANELTTLLKAIIDSKQEFRASISPSHAHSIFYDVLTVLSAHTLTASAVNNILPRSSFPIAIEAAKLLVESLLARFPNIVCNKGHPILNVKTYINIIQEFTTGQLVISQEEVANMLALLKNQDLPSKIQSTSPSTWDKESTGSGSGKERRSRLDPAVLLFEQVALPIMSIPMDTPLNDLLAKEVLRIFRSLKASQKFVSLCLTLPNLKLLFPEKINLQSESIRSFYTKRIVKVPHDLLALAEELSFVYRLLEMSLFAPIASEDANELVSLGVATINAAFYAIHYMYHPSSSSQSQAHSVSSTTHSPSQQQEHHHLGMTVVAQSIWTQKRIKSILKEHSGPWLNFSFLMSKILVENVHSYMVYSSSEKLKASSSSTHAISLIAVQNVWNECIIAMGSLAVSLIQNFIGLYGDYDKSSVDTQNFNVDSQLSNNERIKLLLNCDTNQLEFWVQILTLSYRKACRLKIVKKQKETKTAEAPKDQAKEPPAQEAPTDLTTSKKEEAKKPSQEHTTNEVDVQIEDDNHSASDLMTTDDEDDDEPDDEDDKDDVDVEADDERPRPVDDEEHILGTWIESVLASPPLETEISAAAEAESKLSSALKSSEMVIDGIINEYLSERSAQGFIESALLVVNFLTKNIVSNESSVIQQFVKNTVNETTMSLIAVVLKDLDHEKSNTEVGTISTVYEDSLNKLYSQFSVELGKLVQNFLAKDVLSTSLITLFLEQLGIDINSTARWPLSLHQNSLAVLVQVILLKQDKENYVQNILKRVMETLAENISADTSFDDLPVEHAQALVFLFHTLTLMQKKAVMIDTSNTLVKVSNNLKGQVSPHQIFGLSRLLLIFDYFLRQLYEPDMTLVHQIQYNLFHEMNVIGTKSENESDSIKTKPSRLFIECLAVKDESESHSHPPFPKFYNLIPIEPNYQESPKLDGLSLNFIMNKNDDKMEYIEIISSLLRLFQVKISPACPRSAVHYMEYYLTRLIYSLPPPVELLETMKEKVVDFAGTFYHLIWLPRLQNKVYGPFIRDTFSKQGLNPTYIEEVINRAKESFNSREYSLKLLQALKVWMINQGNSSCPTMIYSIEAVLCYLTMNLDLLKEDDSVITLAEVILDEGLKSLRNKIIQEEDIELQAALYHFSSISSSYLVNNIIALVSEVYLDSKYQPTNSPSSFPLSSQFSNDLLPNESYVLAIVNGHMKETDVNNIKHVFESIVKFIRAIIGVNANVKEKLDNLLHPLLLDTTTEYVADIVNQSGEREIGKVDTKGKLLQLIIEKSIRIVVDPKLRLFLKKEQDDSFKEELLDTLCILIKQRETDGGDKPSIVQDVVNNAVATNDGNLFKDLVFLIVTSKNTGVIRKACNFLTIVLPFIQKDSALIVFKTMSEVKKLPKNLFTLEFYQDENLVTSVTSFLSALLNLIAAYGEETIFVATLLKETIDMTKICMLSRTSGGVLTTRPYTSFCLVVKVMIQMAGLCPSVDGLSGHGLLFQQMSDWFYDLVQELDSFFNVNSEEEEFKKDEPYLNAVQAIVEYLLDIGAALYSLMGGGSTGALFRNLDRESTPGSSGTPPNEPDDDLCESELGYDEQGGDDDDDSGGEDSDEEGLNNRLCTYTITQKEFMSQHWYHCHTCGMVDGVGVCSVCARVCHKGHDVTYAKFGSFFCDCGARVDGGCLALTRRTGVSNANEIAPTTPANTQEKRGSVSVDRPSSPTENKPSNKHSISTIYQGKTIPSVTKQNMEELMREFLEFSLRARLLTVKKLNEVVCVLAGQKTGIGAYRRVQESIKRLRTGKGVRSEFDACDDLVIATLGSQEGAFENIKLQYNGDQGSLIRQLITSQVIRHTTIAALSAPRRNYLAVSQEKNKLTILQLSALLSGGDSNRKKLTLPRLATLTLPFMALTMATNPIRDDVIAVCGLKDCEVVMIGTGGSISSPLVVTSGLEGQNHIIKPLWVYGSEMELSLVCTDCVKIYDLGKDTSAPVYHFLIPSGKIRDAAFIIQDSKRHIAIMGADGRIYYEKLDESTSIGAYYVTNDLNGEDNELSESADSSSKIVSIYYSHALKLLFYTYLSGKSFVGTIDNLDGPVPISRAVLITADTKSCNLGLSLWTEVIGHPGLVFAIGSNSTPYCMLLTGKANYIQEIRMTTGKTKPIDLIAIRHPGSGKLRTSLLILSDDGSLRVCDSTEKTEYWLSPRLRPQESLPIDSKTSLSKHAQKLVGVNRRMSKHTKLSSSGTIVFPADFFEHCQPLTDVEFGGSDLLHVYNVAQLKNRLNSAGMYIVCAKSSGFNLEATCSDGSVVIMGFRVLLGTQDINRVPTYIQVFGRSVPVNLTRPRWYDIPLTREESLLADQKITITFGPSNDSGSVTIVDSVKIYGKSKEAFGWPDEAEEVGQPSSATICQTVKNSNDDGVIEKLITNCLELCELSFTICRKEAATDSNETLKLVTSIYLENYPAFNNPCRNFMCSILSHKNLYYEHRDFAVYTRCLTNLMELNDRAEKDIDPELFHHIVCAIKNIALVRPLHILDYEYVDLGYGEMSVPRVIATICSVFKRLMQNKPSNQYIVAVDSHGLQRIEQVAMGLADIIYSLMVTDINLVGVLSPYLMSLLLSRESTICVPVRTVIVKRMRPTKPSRGSKKPRPSITGQTPESAAESPREDVPPPQPQPRQAPHVEIDEPIIMMGHGHGHGQGNEEMPMLNPLDEYMGEDGYPPVIDIQSDAEDEAMVELAIALSLQEQAGGAELAIQGIQDGLQALEGLHQDVMSGGHDHDEEEDDEQDGPPNEPPAGGESDDDARTASPPGSDDEAMGTEEGSTMRNSERGGSGSSGSSNADASNKPPSNPGPSQSSTDQTRNATDSTTQAVVDMKPFKVALLRALSSHVTQCNSALSLIPLLQVTLVIISDLDGVTEEEVETLQCLIQNLMVLIDIKDVKRDLEWERNDKTEMTLVILRMLSICLARWRGSDQKVDNNWIAKCAAKTVEESGLIPFCREMLHILRNSWKGSDDPVEAIGISVGGLVPSNVSLLKPAPITSPPDFTPFFVKPYIKSHANDILEELPLLLSEMILRVPYQIKKVLNIPQLFDLEWEELLCEILQNRNVAFIRRQARKLLLNIAESRDNYHLLRDLYNMNHHLTQFYKLIGYELPASDKPASTSSFVDFMTLEKQATKTKLEFRYSQLVLMVEHLNICIEIATQRPTSWQTFCRRSNALLFIVKMSCSADESLTTAILTLLKLGIDGLPFEPKGDGRKPTFDIDKSENSIAHQIIDKVEKRTFLEFLKKYLLEHPQMQTRWIAHSLALGFFFTSDCSHQLKLVYALWELWAFVPGAGSRAAQFVDILGYATLNNEELKSKDLREQLTRCVSSIEQQGKNILKHPNANIYSQLVPFVSVDGYYLESEPCEVCYNIDKPFSSQKLTSIKADSKFTANSQIIKLTTTLNIIRLSLRLSEIKKIRMIKTMAIYYSPKNISIVDLKNSRNLWQLARRVTLQSGQTEVKFDFSVPITAANLIIEFIDFYENVQANVETLQCPRCSASVPSQPGVCSNCGENVFQCHKCRAINYDERDPFLCHSCGFCKYCKMDITLLAKSVVAVDPVENEEDHKKAETAISTLLEKADMTYKQQQSIKSNLENMLQSIKERKSMAGLTSAALSTTPSTTSSSVTPSQAQHSYAVVAAAAANALNNNLVALNVAGNSLNGANLPIGIIGSSNGNVIHPSGSTNLILKNVQSLAYCYAIDCKNSYEELNRLMRKVSAFRKEMLKMDQTSITLDTMDNVTCRKCYGCMASGITLSLKLLQALITAGSSRDTFDPSFLSFLLRLSQSAGSTILKEQVKNALCFFVKDDSVATSQLTELINNRVITAFNKESWSSDLSFETSEEISLLASLLQMYDSCWEIKLKSLMRIFLHAIKKKDPACLLPCLKIIQNFVRTTNSGDKEKQTVSQLEGVHINLEAWLDGDESHSFENWKKRLPKFQPEKTATTTTTTTPGPSSSQTSTTAKKRRESTKREKKELNTSAQNQGVKKKETYYIKKYGRAWIDKLFRMDSNAKLELKQMNWMRELLFCPSSIQTRTVTAALLKDLAQTPQRRAKIMELLTSFIEYLPENSNGESCREFMELYRDLAMPAEYSAFLNVKGALNIVCKLLDDQIEKLHHLESVTLHSDLSQGVAVYELSKLLSTLAIPSVRRTKRISLLSTVLGGYLALKRLRLHRTRPIEEAQEILLQLLEEITSGTEEETKVFMQVCVETLKKCPTEDLATPVFVFERLCSLIVHEESDVAEFYVILDKDPQQEDFLQGRMLGNPYSSTDNGLGPLMRDVKNKICTDCELVALLEDDNGMELLVNNKIISLDLPVKEVYKRLWVPSNGQAEPMRVVYRMRGLLGDATEEFVETFASQSEGPEDNETTYKLANVLVQCGGLKVVLTSLKNLLKQQFVMSKGKPFIAVILKLVTYCVKIKYGRKALTDPELHAVETLLPVLKLCLEFDLTTIQGSSGVVHLTGQVLEILDMILSDAGLLDENEFKAFAQSRGSIDDIKNLLALTDKLKGKSATLTTYLKVLGCLSYTDKDIMSVILDEYTGFCEFFRFDEDSNPEFSFKLEQFCTLVSNIQVGPYGATFKDLAIERNTLEKCLHYLRTRAPSLEATTGRPADSDDWKEMVTKPALKYVLRLIAGFASNHSPTQEALSEYIYVIHQLEQVSSDEHVGSLAENALEGLRSHTKIWQKVEGARRATREEKKRMAMAMRQRQLNTMGMKTNERGQVTTAISSMLEQMEDLAEETGLVCVICREGYKYQPTKVLGIYTFSKKCLVEEADIKARKMFGYCTVSHFNVVHIDCHMAAIRLARSRDEWESASLQNANTRCNGLIPLWGPQVPESAFAACLARHNAYLQEATANRDVGFSSGVHDIKLLLLRFAEEKTFHEDTGGGGPESNMHLIPYLFHTALYVLNTTRASPKESSAVDKFLNQSISAWKDEVSTVEGTYYQLIVSVMVHSPAKFKENRITWLKRILAVRGIRSNRQASTGFAQYRAGLIYLALINGFYTIVFKDVPDTGEWSSVLADYIRRNDEALLKSTTALLNLYQQKLVTATSIENFIEILDLAGHPGLQNVSTFLADLWHQIL